jgi:hypothetical protein
MKQGRTVLYLLAIGTVLILVMGGLFIESLVHSDDQQSDDDNDGYIVMRLSNEGGKLIISTHQNFEIEPNMKIVAYIDYGNISNDIFVNGFITTDSLIIYFVDADESGSISTGDYFYKTNGAGPVFVQVYYRYSISSSLLAEAEY